VRRVVLSIAVLLLLAAAEGVPPAPVDEVFASGETLDFSLTWLRMSGGSAHLTVAPLAGDASKLRLISIAQSNPSFSRFYNVRDEIESIVDRETFSTLHYRKLLREGKRNKDETTVIDPAKHEAVRRGDEYSTVPTPVFDPLSLIFQLRRLELVPGKVHRFPVFADGKLYTLEANVIGRDTLTTEAGTFRTVVVQPKMEAGGIFRDDKGKLTIWYTDDARHMPVRISTDVKIGSITATLRHVTTGVSKIEPSAALQSK
jgi:hypothetical protein